MRVIGIVLTLVILQATPPPGPAPVEAAVEVVRSFGELVPPERLVLRGARGRVRIAVPVSRRIPIHGGTLEIRAAFRGAMLPQANVHVHVGGIRRGEILRSRADAGGNARLVLALSADDARTGAVVVTLESRLPASTDRCDDELLSSAEVRIDSTSFVRFEVEAARTSHALLQADLLPTRVVIALSGRPISTAQLDTLVRAASELERRGHSIAFVRRPEQTAYALVAGAIALFDILRSAEPVAAPRAGNLTLTQLGVGDLTRDFAHRTSWTIPIDQRLLPAGRMPDRLIVRMVTSPNQRDELMRMNAYVNGHIIRGVNVRGDGSRRTVRLTLPQDQLRIYNEVQLDAERDSDIISPCNRIAETLPAQIQDDSYVVTAGAPGNPKTIAMFVAALPAKFRLFVTDDALRQPEVLLPLVVAARRSMWGPLRVTQATTYEVERLPTPDEPAVLITPASGSETIVRVTRLAGEPILTITPGLSEARLSDRPEDYGGADSVAFGPAGVPRKSVVAAPGDQQDGVNAIGRALAYRGALVFAAMLLVVIAFVVRARLHMPQRRR